MTGRLIQTYRIEELLGEGGMGAVFKATDTVLERPVALKMLRAELLTQPQFLDRFRAEAQILARLNHPNVATLYNFVQEGSDYYMVMEFVEGQTLDQWLAQYGPLPVSLAVQVVQQALEGLQHAHKRGILHRDLKPANLMVTPEGLVKLTDFGIARIMGSQRMTHVNGLVGTPAYMAPEQIQGLDPSPQSDIHAMGLVLYELLSGQVPFATTNQFETMERVMRMVPAPLRPQLSGIPTELDEVLGKALQKKPDDRFPDAHTFQRALMKVAPYLPILEEADVQTYQHPAPLKTPTDDKTLVQNEPKNQPIVATPSPVPTPISVAPKKPKAEPEAVRLEVPHKPTPTRSRLKRTALWIGGIGLGIVVLSNLLVRSGTIAEKTQSPDSLSRVGPSIPASTLPEPAALATNKPALLQKKEVATPPIRQAHPESSPSVQATRPAPQPDRIASVRPVGVRPNISKDDDDDPPPRATTPIATAFSPGPSSAPVVPVAEKPRPEPADNRVAESRLPKPVPAESKGGGAPRSLKLSGGTEVVVALAEPITAATARSGQAISLQVARPVLVGGEVVIPQGATVQGEVSSVSTGGKKDMIEIHIQRIQGLGGQPVSVKGGTFRYVGERNEPLVFKSGQQFVVYTAGAHKFSL